MRGKTLKGIIAAMAAWLLAATPAQAGWPGDLLSKCPLDSVKVGATCVDRYENSVWQIAGDVLLSSAGRAVVRKIQQGKVTQADLTRVGARPLGCFSDQDPYPSNFPKDGNWTPVAQSNPPSPGIYAVSIPGVLPSTCISWLQAEQACALANKRLPTNQEWQRAAAGTRDPGANNGRNNEKCNTSGNLPRSTGSAGITPADASSCVSSWGAQDMVGNVWEWTGDWTDKANNNGCTDWTGQTGIAGNDVSCFGGDGGGENPAKQSMRIPAVILRGGGFSASSDGTSAGVFALHAFAYPNDTFWTFGFRCAR